MCLFSINFQKIVLRSEFLNMFIEDIQYQWVHIFEKAIGRLDRMNFMILYGYIYIQKKINIIILEIYSFYKII